MLNFRKDVSYSEYWNGPSFWIKKKEQNWKNWILNTLFKSSIPFLPLDFPRPNVLSFCQIVWHTLDADVLKSLGWSGALHICRFYDV